MATLRMFKSGEKTKMWSHHEMILQPDPGTKCLRLGCTNTCATARNEPADTRMLRQAVARGQAAEHTHHWEFEDQGT